MRREAETFVDEWTRTFNSGWVADLARFYAPDAWILPPGRSTLVGADAICAYFTDVRAQGFRDYAVDLGDVVTQDASLVASGRWALRGPGGSGPQLYQGNWLNVLGHGPLGWRIAVHMWN